MAGRYSRLRCSLLLACFAMATAGAGKGKSAEEAAAQKAAADELMAELPDGTERLIAAASYGNLTLVSEMLVTGVEVDSLPAEDSEIARAGIIPFATALGAAVIAGHPRVVVELLKAKADPLFLPEGGPRLPPLQMAASQNDPGLLMAMIKGGADMTAHGPDGFTALHYVAVSKSAPKGVPKLKAIELLLGSDGEKKSGIKLDPNMRTRAADLDWPGLQHGQSGATPNSTPLMEAAKMGLADMVEALFRAGAVATLTDNDGACPSQ
jgi:ankyrin repeat protein